MQIQAEESLRLYSLFINMSLIHFKILKKMILKIFQVLKFLNHTVVVNQHKNFRTFLVNTRNALPKLYVVIIGRKYIFGWGICIWYIYTTNLLSSTDYYFTFNHANYACWFAKYHDNLLKLKEEYTQIYTDFENGCFGIRRTNKTFSKRSYTMVQNIVFLSEDPKFGMVF